MQNGEPDLHTPTPCSLAFAADSAMPPDAREEVERRVGRILESGMGPARLFVGGDEATNGLLTAKCEEGRSMLLFASRFSAQDHIQVIAAKVEVGAYTIEALHAAAAEWLSTGIDTYVLDRCPRCNIALVRPVEHLLTKEDFFQDWANDRAIRSWKGERWMGQVMEHIRVGALPQARAALEQIRDHVDCGISYLHQTIALIADAQNDRQAKAAAVKRLQEFGPHSAGEVEFSPDTLAGATFRLIAHFGLQ